MLFRRLCLVLQISLPAIVAGASFLTPYEWLDLAATDSTIEGFYGGFEDGKHGYLVPCLNSSSIYEKSGRVIRFTLNTFDQVEVLDLTISDVGLRGFSGGFQDGSYGYLVPARNGIDDHFGKITRFRLNTFDWVQVLDLTIAYPDLGAFREGFQDGTYGYLVPAFGKVPRFRLSTFDHVEILESDSTDSDLTDFWGGFQDGTYGYLVPLGKRKVARFQLNTFDQVHGLDLTIADAELTGFKGGFQDGTHGYLVPSKVGGKWKSKVARFNLSTFDQVEVLDLNETDSRLKGFCGGFQDGTYGYLVPYHDGSKSGKLTRFRLNTFDQVQVMDLATAEKGIGLKGFRGGFLFGTHGYLVPSAFGKVVRFSVATSTISTTMLTTYDSATTTSLRMTTPEEISEVVTFEGTLVSTTMLTTYDSATTTSLRMTTPEEKSEVVNFEGTLVMAVTNVSKFLEEPEVESVMKIAIAEICEVSVNLVRIVNLSLDSDTHVASTRSLQAIESRNSMEVFSLDGNVRVVFKIVTPQNEDVEHISAIALAEKLDAKSIEEISRIINKVIESEILGKDYEVRVFYKHAGAETTSSPPPAAGKTDTTILLLVTSICGSVVCTISGWYLHRYLRRMRLLNTRETVRCGPQSIRRPSKVMLPTEDSYFLKAAGAMGNWTLLELLTLPQVISAERHLQLRQLISCMMCDVVHFTVDIFILYAVGHRDQDADDSGPGIYHAAAVLKAFYMKGFSCILTLPGVLGNDDFLTLLRTQETDRKTLIVLEAPGLFESRHCLESLYVAQEHGFNFLRIRMDAGLGCSGVHWPGVSESDVVVVKMIKTLESGYFLLPSHPESKLAVLDDPFALETIVDQFANQPSVETTSLSLSCSLGSSTDHSNFWITQSMPPCLKSTPHPSHEGTRHGSCELAQNRTQLALASKQQHSHEKKALRSSPVESFEHHKRNPPHATRRAVPVAVGRASKERGPRNARSELAGAKVKKVGSQASIAAELSIGSMDSTNSNSLELSSLRRKNCSKSKRKRGHRQPVTL